MARGDAMEREMNVQRKLRGGTRNELRAQALRQSECAATARNEARAAKTKAREEGSPTDASA
jgi:hypothetical protein